MNTIKLQSKDGVTFKVDEKIARMSGTLDSLLRDLDVSVDDPEPIPLPVVDAATLEVIIKWAEVHINDPSLSHEDDGSSDEDAGDTEMAIKKGEISAWDKDFFSKLDHSTILEVITAANYLAIKKLMDTACSMIADILKKLTPEEIREQFDIEDDFSEEEKAEIKKQNEWFK